MPRKSCEVCGSEFHARLSVIRTCSTVCRNQLISREREQSHKAIKTCVVCGGEFEVGAQDKARETCSAECGYKLRGSKTRKGPELECVTCGSKFFTSLSQVNAGGGKYCSKQCLYDRNKAKTTRNCECCGNPFSTPPSQMHVKTCSPECGYKLSTGENHPLYKGVTYQVVVDGKKISRRTKVASSEHSSKRRLITQMAIPAWANSEKITEIYRLRDEVAAKTGIEHHVDHIVPLNHPRVCGLHNEFNLQILPRIDNLKKGNRTWPDM